MDYILRTQNGSKLYGLDHALSDDDYIGIFVETPDLLFLGHDKKTVSLRETPDGVRNGPGDVDGQAYSVRHFFHLAAKGNPSLLAILFTPNRSIVDSNEQGRSILANRDLFVSAQAAGPFKGYMLAQLDRLIGKRKGHIPNRPELVEEFGYDVKYASQVARLAFQGAKFLTKGQITLPMPEHERNICMGVRQGNYSYDACIKLLRDLQDILDLATRTTELPESPDMKAIARLSRTIHESTWKGNL